MIFLTLILFSGLLFVFKGGEYGKVLSSYPVSRKDSFVYLHTALLLEDKEAFLRLFPDLKTSKAFKPFLCKFFYLHALEYPDKEKVFDNTIKEFPFLKDYLLYLKGEYLLELNKYREAEEVLRKLRSLKDANYVLMQNLAEDIARRYIQENAFKKFLRFDKSFGLNTLYFKYARIMALKGTGKAYNKELVNFLKKYSASFYVIPLVKFAPLNYKTLAAFYTAKQYRKIVKFCRHSKDRSCGVYYLKSLFKLHKYRDFIKELRNYPESYIDPELWLMGGIAYRRLGYKDSAIYFFFKASLQEDDPKIITEMFYIGFLNSRKLLPVLKRLLAYYRERIEGFNLNLYAGLFFLIENDTIEARHFLSKALKVAHGSDRVKALFYLKKLSPASEVEINDSLYLTYYNLSQGAVLIDSVKKLHVLLDIAYPQKTYPEKEKLIRWKYLIYLGEFELVKREAEDIKSLYMVNAIAEETGNYYLQIYSAVKMLYKLRNSILHGFPYEYLLSYFPVAYTNVIKRYSYKYGVDPLLFMALVREESWFNPRAISPVGAIGLAQIMPYTGRKIWKRLKVPERFETSILFKPELNLLYGIYHFSKLTEEFSDIVFAIAAYNAGRRRARIWKRVLGRRIKDQDILMEFIPISETRGYVKRILRTYLFYKNFANGIF